MKNNPIQDYILKNPRNLSIAATVGEAWTEARERLVWDFLDRLDLRLMKRLRGWRFDRYDRFFADAWPCYDFWRPKWEDQYSICLQCDNYGAKMSFGVSRNKDQISRRPFCPELLSAVRKLHPSVVTHGWWEARVNMRSPEPDWRKPEVLWRMHTDTKFLEEVAEQLLDVARVSESIIDGLVRKYRK